MFEQPRTVLLAGAGGGIAKAIGAELARRSAGITLLTVSRGKGERVPGHTGKRHHLSASLDQADAIASIEHFLCECSTPPNWVINCCGLLHDKTHGPEKSLDQCDDNWLMQSIRINLLTHLHLAQALNRQLQRRQPLLWASLSARVGSIGDNRLGGWYSYRISKAGLNMLIRNLSIEWGRRLENSCVVAIHPGTTDTPLSKPFQTNLAPGKLYSAALSARRMVDVLEQLGPADSGQLLFWDGSQLPW
ncbi:SDR family NAD(P)-dependent oxidoreductase [Microbulbifer spongiae]|uniref:SDR family NAD(P)-dependent oxidoreductase n=1 Tax=Microbulbifer spongiae TaxID=2944933 RepID=A0ABY9E6N8_9GAMM|nr:SDR family NAD(P)-dependent oxidoreductase [Microbulbifer sp. MI-G]WKD48690.1 SDR family NAD(P)-dependent oxidoreductase [Microbulbifer sp. MI-G]